MKKAMIAVTFALTILPMTAMADGNAKKGVSVFRKCKVCHDAVVEKNKIGPHLVNIIGRKAGAAKGYKYSKALKKVEADGWIWTNENLHAYLTNPRKAIPGNKMPFAGLRKQSDRDNLLAYFKTLEAAAK